MGKHLANEVHATSTNVYYLIAPDYYHLYNQHIRSITNQGRS